jgi:hypothetical protein
MSDQAPRLTWANNPSTFGDRDALQSVVDMLHARHPLRSAGCDVTRDGWVVRVVSAATDGTTRLQPMTYMREAGMHAAVIDAADALDEVARRHEGRTATTFATLADAAVLRSAMTHATFEQVIGRMPPRPYAFWEVEGMRWDIRDGIDVQDATLDGGVRVRTEQGAAWRIRRTGPAWDHDGTYVHVVGMVVPPSVAAACSGRTLDETFGIPELLGAGIVVRNVTTHERRGRPSTRITPVRRANPSLDDLVAMSRAMEVARP